MSHSNPTTSSANKINITELWQRVKEKQHFELSTQFHPTFPCRSTWMILSTYI
eukprot:m.74139 g.74139  ORF g.74139 m.74139 type:complete len:53 (-) comp24626_c0_seq1:28-186(-)